MRKKIGKQLLHILILRAATLETSLVQSSMASKGAITSLQAHFQPELVNEGIQSYTKVLLAGGKPTFSLLSLLPPPVNFEVWEPDTAGLPRRWNRPWRAVNPETGPQTTFSPHNLTDLGPILRVAASAEYPSQEESLNAHSTLLGYK